MRLQTTFLASLALATGAHAQITWDFETGNLQGWTATGTAFNNQPTRDNNIAARIAGSPFTLQGRYFIGTFENHRDDSTRLGTMQGDAATGTLTSAPFMMNGPVNLMIGGGNDSQSVYAALLVRVTPENTPALAQEIVDVDTNRRVARARVRLPDGDWWLIARLTGQNNEVMRRAQFADSVYTASTPYSLRGQQARIQLVDNASGPWGHLNVDDIRVEGALVRTDRYRIHVTSSRGGNAVGAEVFLNGQRQGVTDGQGFLDVPVNLLTRGAPIYARERQSEHATHRPGRSVDSTQNWNYRIYTTSAAVQNSGQVVTATCNGDVTQTQEVRLSNSNTMVGLNVILSVEWDATDAELATIRQQMLDASNYLYNATDGQFFFENVEIRNRRQGWDDADFCLHADNRLRPHCDIPFGFFSPPATLLAPGLIHLTRMSDLPVGNSWGGSKVYVHEFGHYGFGLFDEYADSTEVRCTHGTLAAGSPFSTDAPLASCIMWSQYKTFKLCSGIASNPHDIATWQNFMHRTNCWQHILNTYGHPSQLNRSLIAPPYLLQTPETRRSVVGTLPPLISAWEPRFVLRASHAPNLRGAQPLRVTERDGRPISNLGVWLEESGTGRDIYQGQTDDDGRILVLGTHAGERIHWHRVLWSGETRVAMAPAPHRVQVASLSPRAFLPQQDQKELTIVATENTPMLGVGARFVGDTLIVRLDSPEKLAVGPTVTVETENGKQQPLSVAWDESSKAYIGKLTQFPSRGTLTLTAKGVGSDKTPRFGWGQLNLTHFFSKTDNQAHSADGQLDVEALPGSPLTGQTLLIAPSVQGLTKLDPGKQLVSGPFELSVNGKPIALSPKAPLNVRFVLMAGPRKEEIKSLLIVRWDETKGAWQELPTRVNPTPGIVGCDTTVGGVFALIRR